MTIFTSYQYRKNISFTFSLLRTNGYTAGFTVVGMVVVEQNITASNYTATWHLFWLSLLGECVASMHRGGVSSEEADICRRCPITTGTDERSHWYAIGLSPSLVAVSLLLVVSKQRSHRIRRCPASYSIRRRSQSYLDFCGIFCRFRRNMPQYTESGVNAACGAARSRPQAEETTEQRP